MSETIQTIPFEAIKDKCIEPDLYSNAFVVGTKSKPYVVIRGASECLGVFIWYGKGKGAGGHLNVLVLEGWSLKFSIPQVVEYQLGCKPEDRRTAKIFFHGTIPSEYITKYVRGQLLSSDLGFKEGNITEYFGVVSAALDVRNGEFIKVER